MEVLTAEACGKKSKAVRVQHEALVPFAGACRTLGKPGVRGVVENDKAGE